MARRGTPEINAGSMADIAFLLLVFFLVTTTMDVDTGLIRRLPPPPEKDQKDIDIKERNILKILVNSHDKIQLDGKGIDISMLRAEAKDFFRPHPGDESKPEVKTEVIGPLGEIYTSKGVISLKNARGTSYNMYISIQNELAAAVNELRDELSRSKFGKSYADLTDEDQIKAVNKAYPMKISEAEPETIGGN
ncbi:MAG: ExbD/TolR family protein [Hyphomicrobiales bacterium]